MVSHKGHLLDAKVNSCVLMWFLSCKDLVCCVLEARRKGSRYDKIFDMCCRRAN